jgi:II/X family phage/plasmid replication protein
MQDRMIKISGTGEILETFAVWSAIRSDSHQISVCVGSDSLRIQGSPARVIGSGCSVFSSAPASDLDLRACGWAMINYVGRQLDVDFSEIPIESWKCTRVDVTQNYFLPSLADVRSTLETFSRINAGRLRVKQVAGSTVYWNQSSTYASGKAYAKGPHLDYQAKKTPHALVADDQQRQNAGHIIRLEVSLKRHYWREMSKLRWHEMNHLELAFQFNSFFEFIWGKSDMRTLETLVEVNHDAKFSALCQAVAKTPAQGLAAYRTWAAIRSSGIETIKGSMSVSTWTRHQRILLDAGLTRGDLSLGAVTPILRRIELYPVNSWAELARLAA